MTVPTLGAAEAQNLPEGANRWKSRECGVGRSSVRAFDYGSGWFLAGDPERSAYAAAHRPPKAVTI